VLTGRWFSVRQVFAAALVGLVAGYGAFLLTAQTPQELRIPECLQAVAAGFDPWTGSPHGATMECAQLTGAGGQIPVVQPPEPMPPELASRRAIPVPLGFAVGGALTLVGLAVARARRQPEDDEWADSASGATG
jgi:hypothetical protein